MERGFQSMLIAGTYSAGDDNFSPVNSDEPHINRDMSFQSFDYDQTLLSLMPYPYIQRRKTCACSKEEGKWRSVEREEKPKRPKNNPSPEQFNFIPSIMFGQLPELQSVEQMRQVKKESISPTNQPPLTQFQNYLCPMPLRQVRPSSPPPAKVSNRDQARTRRHTLSDKTRVLQKVLPFDKKMDMATVYEETYKYIKFLQAQISVLESMPVASSASSSSPIGSENPRHGNLYGGLGKLNRQQLLQVLVNSPTAQTILYSKGCCIYSLEQLILFKDISEKNFFISGPSVYF